MDLTDKEHVERCRDGNPEDFGLLVDRYQKPLFSFLASRVGNLPQAEEAAQESFVRAFISLKKLRKPESFYSWLLGIAGRVAKEQLRGAFLSGSGHTPRHAARHSHQNAFASLRPASAGTQSP
jgi:RNA polymerase sigma-70 factor (ECF subfamily)